MEGSNGGGGWFRSRSRSRRRKGSSVSARLQPDFDPRDCVRNSQNLGQNALNPHDSDEELDPKTMDFSTLVQFLHPSFIYDHLQKTLHFLKSDKMELCFPNIAPYKETFLVKIANDNQRLMCAVLNDASREVGRQILAVIEENRNVYRWIHMYESGRVSKNVLVYKKMYYNERKTSTSSASEFKTPGPVPTSTKCLSSYFENLELNNKTKEFRFDFNIPKANPCTTKDLARTLPCTAKDPSLTHNSESLPKKDLKNFNISKTIKNSSAKDLNFPTNVKTIQDPSAKDLTSTISDLSSKKDPIIPTSLKINFLNSTIKFLKDDNRLTLELPKTNGEQAEYFASVINQIDTRQKNVSFGFRSLYAPLYTALEELHGKYDLKTILNETLSLTDNVRMILRKVPKGKPIDLRQTMKSVPPEPSSTEFMTKAQKEFLTRQKTVNSVSENFIRTSLQRILDFLDDDARASLEFDKINLEESSFLQMTFTLSRNQEYYKLFNDDCVILLKKIFRVERYETQHKKMWKINTQVGKLHRFTRLGNVTFEKVPTGGKKSQFCSQVVPKRASPLTDKSRDVCDSRSNTVSTDSGRSRDTSKERSVPDIAQRLMELSTRCESTSSLDQSSERLGFGNQKDERDILNRSLSKDRSASERSGSASRRRLSKERQRKISKERRCQPTKYNIAFQSAGEQIIDCTTVNGDTCHDTSRDTEVIPRQFGRKKKLMDDLSIPVDIDKAKRMMMGMGWDGGPLGTRGDGIIEPIMPAIHLAPGAGLGHIKQVSRSTTDFRMTLLKTVLTFVTGPNQETAISFTQPLTKREIRFIKPTVSAFNKRSPLGLRSEEMELVKRILEEMLCQPLLIIAFEILDQNREIRLYKTEGTLKGKKRKKRSTLTTLINSSTPSLILNSNCDDAEIITTDQILNLDLPVDDYSHKAYKNLACKVTFMQKIKDFLQTGDEKKEYVCDFILNNKQREYIHLLVTLMNKRDGKYKFGTRIENDLYYDIRRSLNNCFMTVIFTGQKFVLSKRVYQKRFTNSSIDKPLVSKDAENTIIYEKNTVRRATDKSTDISDKSDSERDRKDSKIDKKRDKKPKVGVNKETDDISADMIANEKINDDKNDTSLDVDDSDFLTFSDRDDILIIDDTDLGEFESDSESDKSESKDSGDEYEDLESDCDDLKDISDDSMLLDMLEKENESLCIDIDTNSLGKGIGNDDPDIRSISKDSNDGHSRSSANSDSKNNLKHLTPYMESHTPPHDMNLDLFDVERDFSNDGSKIIDNQDKEGYKDNKAIDIREKDKNYESDEEISLTPPLADLNILKLKTTQQVNEAINLEKRKETLLPANDTTKKVKVNLDKGDKTKDTRSQIIINNKRYIVLDKDQIDDDEDLDMKERLRTETNVIETKDIKELTSEEIKCIITESTATEFIKRLNKKDKTVNKVLETTDVTKNPTKIVKKSLIVKEEKTPIVDIKETSKTMKKILENPQNSTEYATPRDSNEQLNVLEDLYAGLTPPLNEENVEKATEVSAANNPEEICAIPKTEATIEEVDLMEGYGLSINKMIEINKSDIEGNASDVNIHAENALSKVESREITKESSQDSFRSEICEELSEEYLTPGESIEKLNEVETEIDIEKDTNESITLKDLDQRTELKICSNDPKNIESSENSVKDPNKDSLKVKGKIQPDIVVIDYNKVDGVISPTFRYYNDLKGYISDLNIKKDVHTDGNTKLVEDSENCGISKEGGSNSDRQVSTNVLKLEVNNNGDDKTDSKHDEQNYVEVIVENIDSKLFVETQCDSKQIIEDQGENESDLKIIDNPNSYQNIDSNGCNSKSENLILKRAISRDSLHMESSPSSSKRSRSDSENSDRILKKYKYVLPKKIIIFPENLEKISVECVQAIQKCISENIDDSVILPLLECNGIQNGGLIYTCYNDQTLIWLKKLLNASEFKFKIADTEFVEEKTFKLKLKLNSFIPESTEIILNRLELFNTGLNTTLWEVLDRHVSELFIVLIVKVDHGSYQYISENNFALFAGVTKAQFSAIWD